jgi:site-specific DNA recombinase
MKLIGYVRVSTEQQADNTSIEEQKKRIKAYCEAHGHRLVKVFEEVGSGKNTQDRPYFNEALEALESADGIIALKLDRVARSTRDVLTLVEDVLQPQDKALVLLDLNIDTSSPMGMMILTVMAAVAQLERGMIRERTQGGRMAKATQGGYAFGAPSYGYKSVDGALIEVPEEQAVIELIRRHRRGHKSMADIASFLNAEGYKTKRGAMWQSKQVYEILKRLKAS